jgi:hypothetical protein
MQKQMIKTTKISHVSYWSFVCAFINNNSININKIKLVSKLGCKT